MKKGILIAVAVIVGLAAVYGGYSFFMRLRNAYIVSGYNAAIRQVQETSQKEGQVIITIEGKKTILVPQK